MFHFVSSLSIFQSTLSVRRATSIGRHAPADRGISIHALRKESDLLQGRALIGRVISIHALRKESDISADWGFPRGLISIHALRKESDGMYAGQSADRDDFNPRSP